MNIEKIYSKIKDISKNKNINVELGFLPENRILTKDKRRGGFDRIQISTEDDIYFYLLLAEKKRLISVLKKYVQFYQRVLKMPFLQVFVAF